MKKRAIGLFMAAVMTASSVTGFAHERKSISFEEGKSAYTVNGTAGDMGTAPEMKDGVMFVPISLVQAANEEVRVGWEAKTKTVTLDFWEGWVVIEANVANGSISYIKGGKKTETKYKAYLKNNKAMIPVELIAELLEMEYKWDAAAKKGKWRDYHWMSYPGFSDDFEVVTFTEGGEDLSRITKGSWLVLSYKDDQLDGLYVENFKGKEIYDEVEGKDPYPEYMRELGKQFAEKGVEGMTPVKGHEKESKEIIEMTKRALKRKEGFREEFAIRYDEKKPLKDGEYTEKFHGFYSMSEFEVKVTVKGGVIEKVEVLKYSDDSYVKEEFEGHDFLSRFVGKRSPRVDAMSGATFSSKGVMKAVEKALKKAQN